MPNQPSRQSPLTCQPPCQSPHTELERRRVLYYRAGRPDWMSVAASNGFPKSSAYDLVAHDRSDNLKRGGARAKSTKVTADVLRRLEGYLNENCTFTATAMATMLPLDIGLRLSTTTISRHLVGMTYTVKQICIEPSTCNNDVNKAKRQEFAKKLLEHQTKGNCIVYYDETNYNVYCTRNQGRAKRGTRATVVLPPSKGPNLQFQCAVNSSIGLVHHRLQRGSIQMDCNAEFVEEIYQKVKESEVFRASFSDKIIVIVLDNAPAHSQTEQRVVEHADIKLLRLGPYSPMCNPIEGCFSVFKSEVKRCLAIDRVEICNRRRGVHRDDNGELMTLGERQMQFLESAAQISMCCMTPTLVGQMELHCHEAVIAARDNKNMRYGT